MVRILTRERDEMVQFYSLQHYGYYQKKGKNLNIHLQGADYIIYDTEML